MIVKIGSSSPKKSRGMKLFKIFELPPPGLKKKHLPPEALRGASLCRYFACKGAWWAKPLVVFLRNLDGGFSGIGRSSFQREANRFKGVQELFTILENQKLELRRYIRIARTFFPARYSNQMLELHRYITTIIQDILEHSIVPQVVP